MRRVYKVFMQTGEHMGPWLLPGAALALWQWAAVGGWLPRELAPAPLDVARAFARLCGSGELWADLWASSQRAAVGLALGGGLGLVLGLLNASFRSSERLLDSTLQMVRNVPHLALIPLVIAWCGIGQAGKEFLVALGVFFPVYVNTFHGIRSIDPALVTMARSYDLRGWPLFRHVVLPGAMPSILVGLRFALGWMWLTLIVAETISSNDGIGYLAMNAREFLQMDVVLVAILLYAMLGKLADTAARLLERGLLRWDPSYCKQT